MERENARCRSRRLERLAERRGLASPFRRNHRFGDGERAVSLQYRLLSRLCGWINV